MLLTPHTQVDGAVLGGDFVDRAARLKQVPDDKAMLRAVAELTRDLAAPNPRIFWSDFLVSALVGYAGLAVAIMSGTLWVQCVAALVSIDNDSVGSHLVCNDDSTGALGDSCSDDGRHFGIGLGDRWAIQGLASSRDNMRGLTSD